MKILVKETKEVEVDVTFPAYFVYPSKSQEGCGIYYKLLSEKGAVSVTVSDRRPVIDIDPLYNEGVVAKIISSNDEYEPCTEQEFNLAYSKVLQALMEYATSFPVENTVSISEQHAA